MWTQSYLIICLERTLSETVRRTVVVLLSISERRAQANTSAQI